MITDGTPWPSTAATSLYVFPAPSSESITRCLKENSGARSPGIGSVSSSGWRESFLAKVRTLPWSSRNASLRNARAGSMATASAMRETHLKTSMWASAVSSVTRGPAKVRAPSVGEGMRAVSSPNPDARFSIRRSRRSPNVAPFSTVSQVSQDPVDECSARGSP